MIAQPSHVRKIQFEINQEHIFEIRMMKIFFLTIH